MKEFILEYIENNKNNWKVKPKLHYGKEFQDNLIMVFGEPSTAIFTHLDSIGFTVKYNNEIVKIGGPVTDDGIVLVGEDSIGKIEGKIINKGDKIYIDYPRTIDRGTSLVFKMNFRENKDYVQSCYLDNRLGVFNALHVER